MTKRNQRRALKKKNNKPLEIKKKFLMTRRNVINTLLD